MSALLTKCRDRQAQEDRLEDPGRHRKTGKIENYKSTKRVVTDNKLRITDNTCIYQHEVMCGMIYAKILDFLSLYRMAENNYGNFHTGNNQLDTTMVDVTGVSGGSHL